MRPTTNRVRLGPTTQRRCGICGGLLPPDGDLCEPQDAVTVDHIVPLSKGGTDDPSNLQLAHWRCNQKKADQ